MKHVQVMEEVKTGQPKMFLGSVNVLKLMQISRTAFILVMKKRPISILSLNINLHVDLTHKLQRATQCVSCMKAHKHGDLCLCEAIAQ